MEKEFVPYEIALALKELGFYEPCFGYYYNRELSFGARTSYGEVVEVPTFSQAFRWFREKYKLVGLIEIGTQEYSFIIFDEVTDSRKITSSMNWAHEEAELECLKKLIEIVKTNAL